MERYCFEQIYDAVMGEVLEEYSLPGIQDAFCEGSFCAMQYEIMWEAYQRLLMRTGQVDEDPDVEIMRGALSAIQKELCYRMYLYGAQFGGE